MPIAAPLPRGTALARAIMGLALLGAAAPAHAEDGPADDRAICERAAAAAEAAYGVPPGLLRAIGLVESGRINPMTGRAAPWPWSVNAGGQGRYYATKAEAVAAVAELQRASPGFSVDVGCFQISLRHHPTAFPSLDAAFDPAANADYAARFLSTLRARWGGWEEAVGPYHSATPAEGAPYRATVLARWTGAPPGALNTPLGPLPGAPAGAPARAAPLLIPVMAASRPAPLPAARLNGITVWTPVGALPAQPRAAGRLPRVIVPTGGAT